MADSLSPDQVLDAVGEWSLLQVKEFVDKFEEKFDVSAAAMAAPVAVAGGAAEQVEEQTEFTVLLEAAGSAKIKVIKEVRVLIPDLGLKEAKELVDAAPKEILKDLTKEEAEKARKQLEDAGATVTLK